MEAGFEVIFPTSSLNYMFTNSYIRFHIQCQKLWSWCYLDNPCKFNKYGSIYNFLKLYNEE